MSMISRTFNLDARQATVNSVRGEQHNYNYYAAKEGGNGSFLDKLKPANMDPSNRSGCLAGTRCDLLKTIIDWVCDPTSHQSVLWLSGIAGSGKSTISTSIANHFRRTNQLGAFLFFNRGVAECNDPASVVQTLAYQLGTFHPLIGETISTVIEEAPNVLLSPISYQFEQLISSADSTVPSLPVPAPIVFIFDALDECGTVSNREALLEIIARELCDLISFRVIITSRPDMDIVLALESHPRVLQVKLDVRSALVDQDISMYFHHHMALIHQKKRHLRIGWPGEDAIRDLTGKSSGLFVWASTAVKFINGHDPQKRVLRLLQDDRDQLAESGLDALYRTALESVGMWEDPDFVEDFRAIFGMILFLRNPLSTSAIDKLLDANNGRPSLDTINQLGCVVLSRPTVRLLHPSFSDFLLTKTRCCRDVWFFRPEAQNRILATQCIIRLGTFLRYNMLNLTLSIGLSNWTEGRLPEDIQYACTFWISHTCAIDLQETPPPFMVQLHEFLNHHLMHWLEAMSIINKSRDTIKMLRNLAVWVNSLNSAYSGLQELSDLIKEARRFTQVFVEIIECHPLLVYSAAIPFIPTNSVLHRRFFDSNSFAVVSSQSRQTWPPLLAILEGHGESVTALTTSSADDGTSTLISGSDDGTVRVWDGVSGSVILPPLLGHDGSILSVAISRDGVHIASSSEDGTIRLWNTETGVEVLSMSITAEPIHQGDTAIEINPLIIRVVHHSISFSPDGKQIISGSNDAKIRVWDLQTGDEVSPALQGHTDTILSLCLSPKGTQIASGSNDKTIRIWDFVSRAQSLPSLKGHLDIVTSVSFFPDGKRIASGSWDRTVRLWDVNTGARLGVTRISHNLSPPSQINCVALSPGNGFIVVGCNHTTISVLDANLELGVAELRGHGDFVRTLCLSADGTLLFSGSDDMSIRVWDVECWANTLKAGDRTAIYMVQFSPDGSKLVSVSFEEEGFRLWDASSATEIQRSITSSSIAPRVEGVSFAPDGNRIVLRYGWNLRVCDLGTSGDQVPVFIYVSGPVRSAEFSPSGNRILTCSDEIKIWDARSGSQLFSASMPQLSLTELPLNSARFSQDGSAIITVSKNMMMRTWRAASRHLVPMSDPPCESCTPSHKPWPPKIGVSKDGWIINLETRRTLSKIPTTIDYTAVDSCGGSVAIGTRDGQVLVMRFPFAALDNPSVVEIEDTTRRLAGIAVGNTQ